MRKVIFLFAIIGLSACNNDATKVQSATDTKTGEDISLPYPVSYSAKYETGDPKHAQTILQLWKYWDEGALAKGRDLFADTVQMYTSNGMAMQGHRDSVLAWTKQYRDMFSKIESRVDAITYLKSTDRDENWANVWGMETFTDLSGKTDSVFLHESWRFNKEGKIDLMLQYTRASLPPAKQ